MIIHILNIEYDSATEHRVIRCPCASTLHPIVFDMIAPTIEIMMMVALVLQSNLWALILDETLVTVWALC